MLCPHIKHKAGNNNLFQQLINDFYRKNEPLYNLKLSDY